MKKELNRVKELGMAVKLLKQNYNLTLGMGLNVSTIVRMVADQLERYERHVSN